MKALDFLKGENTAGSQSKSALEFLRGSNPAPFQGYGGLQSAPPKPKAPTGLGSFSTLGAELGTPAEADPLSMLERKVREAQVGPVAQDPELESLYDEFPDYIDFIQKKMKIGIVMPSLLRKAVMADKAEKRRQAIGKVRAKFIDFAPQIDQMELGGADIADIETQVSLLAQQKKYQEEQKKLADEQKRLADQEFKRQQAEFKAQTDLAKIQAKQQADLAKEAAKSETAILKAETKTPTIGRQAAGLGAEVATGAAGQVAGAALAPYTLGISYPVLSFAGGFAGSLAAQEIEGREEVSYGRAIRDGLLNLLPALKPLKAATTAGRVAKTVARGAAIGAGAGAAGEVIETGIEEQRLPTIEEIQSGSASGAIVGGAFAGLGEAFKLAYRKFAGKTTAELDAAYKAGDPDARLIVDSLKKTSKEAPEDVAPTSVIERAEQKEAATPKPIPPAVEPTQITTPKATSVRLGETTFNFRDGEWYREGSTIPVKSTTMLRVINEEASRAIPIRETETIPMGEGTGGRPPVDREIREQAAPEDQVQAQGEIISERPGTPEYMARRERAEQEAKDLGIVVRRGAATPEIERTIEKAKELRIAAEEAALNIDKTPDDYAIIGAEKLSRGIAGKAWVDEMTSEFGPESATRDIYGKSTGLARVGISPQPKPPEGMEERRTVTRAGEGRLKEEAVKLRESGEAFREVTPVKAIAQKAADDTNIDSASVWSDISAETDTKTRVAKLAGYISARADKGADLTMELDELAKLGTEAGTILRAIREANLGTPQGRARLAVQSFVQFAKRKDQAVSEEALDEIRSRFQSAEKITDEAERTKAYYEAIDFSMSKIKLNWWDVLDAYRYTNTLSSPQTHERNIIGNLFNVALARPMALAGTKDFKGAARYLGGAAKNIAEASRKFKEAFGDATIPVRSTDDFTSASATDDFGREYNRKIPRVFQYIPKLLEAQDQFFSTLVRGGEMQRLIASGVNPDQAKMQADKLAERYLYRDKIGETMRDKSANAFSIAIDALGSTIQYMRQTPYLGRLTNLFIMFVRTPVKIAEAGFEFSPVGYIAPGVRKEGGKIWQRDWGLTDEGIARGKYGKSFSKLTDEQKADVVFWKKERLGRANAGTAITALGGLMALNGDTTWAEPSDPQEKAAFYESGRKPYSVRIGDKWVPYITFGPLALAFAIPSAVRDWAVDNPRRVTESVVSRVANVITGIAKFYMSTTPVDSMAKFFQTLNGKMGFDQTKIMETLGFTASQFIPLSSLQRYINKWIDGEFKQTDGFLDEVKSNVIGQSKDLVPYTTMDGLPAKRTAWDILPPFSIGISKETGTLEERRKQLEKKNLIYQKTDQMIKDFKGGRVGIAELEAFLNSVDEESLPAVKSRLRMSDPEIKAALEGY